MAGTRNLLRAPGNGDGMNLEEVARNLNNAREVLGAVETRNLAGAAMLSEIAENRSRTAESRLVGVSYRRRQRDGLWARFRKQSEN